MKPVTRAATAMIGALYAVAIPPAWAQFSYHETVGTENSYSYFWPVPQTRVDLNVVRARGAIISNPDLTRGLPNLGRLTRHSRNENSTGIGGSSFQTESVTSESRPALQLPSSISIGTPLFSRPTVSTGFDTTTQNPALQSIKVQYPSVDEPALFGRSPETFTHPRNDILGPLPDAFSTSGSEFQFGN